MFRGLILSLLLLPAVVAAQEPAAAPQPSIELPPAVARVLRDYEKAWGSKDAAGLARLFAEDGYVLPNGGVPVKGRAAIERHYAGSGGPLFLRAFAYATDGVARRGPVTLRLRDLEKLRESLAKYPGLEEVLRL